MFTREEFDEFYSGMTYTATLSDGETKVELRPGGSRIAVRYGLNLGKRTQ